MSAAARTSVHITIRQASPKAPGASRRKAGVAVPAMRKKIITGSAMSVAAVQALTGPGVDHAFEVELAVLEHARHVDATIEVHIQLGALLELAFVDVTHVGVAIPVGVDHRFAVAVARKATMALEAKLKEYRWRPFDVVHRPARCVLYVCDSLHREVFHAGQLDEVERSIVKVVEASKKLFPVLIIGGGPAGLTAAFELQQAGVGVTVFEATVHRPSPA